MQLERPIFVMASRAIVRPAGSAPDEPWFDPVAHLGPRGHKYFSQATRYWLAACAALPAAAAGLSRGIVLGTNFGGRRTLAELSATIAVDPADLSALTAPNFCLNLIAGVAAIRHHARHCNATTTTPRAGGIDALLIAAGELARGACDEMLAGAAEDGIDGAGAYLDGAVALRLTAAACAGPALVAHGSAFWPDWERDPALLAEVLRRQLGGTAAVDLCVIHSDSQAAGHAATALLPALAERVPPIEIHYLEPGHATLEPLLGMLASATGDGSRLFIYAGAAGQVRVLLFAGAAC